MLVLLFAILNLYVPLSSSCPSGTIEGPIVGDCYKFFATPTDWVNAENNCSQQDGHLSSISNVFTNAFIQNLLNNFTLTNQVFIGGSTIFRSKKWTWSDGTNFTYTNWAKGQPANSEVACASFNPSTGTWYSQSCFSSFPYFCKINAIASTTSRTTLLTSSPYSKGPTWPPGTCLNEYTYFNETGKCYKVYPGSNLSFPLAENRCQMDGAHLASIHSSSENNFVASKFLYHNKHI